MSKKAADGDREMILEAVVASALCREFGDHEDLPCDCAERGRTVCPFACDFLDEGKAVIRFLRAAGYTITEEQGK